MTTRKYSSRSQQTTLTAALTSSGTSATVVSGTALLGGVTISAGETFTVVIDPDTALEEIVDVTAVSTNTLTITRGIDGSTGQAHSAGAVVRHMAIGRDYREANTHIENSTTAHGLTIADVITTTNTKTLTNKTLTSPTITGTGAIAGTFTGNLTGNVTGNVSGSAGSATGNAATATALATGRTFQLTGDVEASGVTFDGTGNVSLTTVIGTGAIVNADVNSAAAIAATKIAGTAVTQADTGTVTSTMIANGTIVNADINASAAIAKTKLDLGGTITSADLVDGTIVATDIADGTITAAKMVTDPYARANHTGTQAASTISDFDTQVRTSRLDQMAAPTGSVSLNSQKITSLATPTTNTDAATKLYVDTKVADLVNSAPSTLDTLGEIATAIQAGGTVYDSFVLKAGSTMTGALTLSGAPTVDLHAATKAYVDTVAGSATAAAASAAAAATTYDNFDDRYLGAKSSAPTLDNDGNALLTGAIYWNSVSNAMYAWTGTEWGSISSTAAIYRYRFNASGGETSVSGTDANGLTLSYIPGKEQVYLNGVLLVRTTDYTASNGTSITSLAALAASDVLEIITFTSFELASAIEETFFDAKGDILVGTAADTVGKLAVGTNGYYLKANSATATGLEWAAVDLSTKQDVVANVSSTEIGYLDGVTSAIQTQIDAKSDKTATINTQTASYTLVLGDADEIIEVNNASANNLTVPPNSSVAFPIGTQIDLVQYGAGQTTVVAGSGVTIRSKGAALKLTGQYSGATLYKRGTDEWVLVGDLVA